MAQTSVAGEWAAGGARGSARLIHEVLFYEGDEEYVQGLKDFVQPAVDAGEAVLVAVPGERHAALRGGLPAEAELVDMTEVGRNPARLLPLVGALLDEESGRPVRFVGESIWPGRPSSEVAEAQRHEALLNLAFAARPLRALCPYDRRLELPELVAATGAHSALLERGQRVPCHPPVADPLELLAASDHPLARRPDSAVEVRFDDGLGPFRHRIEEHARAAGLGEERMPVFALAANEAAANTVRHAGGEGTARFWTAGGEIVCELSDSGRLTDPLVGSRLPDPGMSSGRGIWLMNQVCDLVELRSDAQGTVVRLHMALGST